MKMHPNELETYIQEYEQKSDFYLAMGTEEVLCDRLENFDMRFLNQLLEIRIFNSNSEFHAVRSDLSKPFQARFVQDDVEKMDALDYMDEDQYLDIDASKSHGVQYVTTGGGKYTLPIEHAEKIRIRNYIVYNDEGEAQIKDFRIVAFLREGGEKS